DGESTAITGIRGHRRFFTRSLRLCFDAQRMGHGRKRGRDSRSQRRAFSFGLLDDGLIAFGAIHRLAPARYEIQICSNDMSKQIEKPW
ncbi:MAG TPA: hypothetical protein VGP72_00900, partial [Planctomycetota bacterium]